MLNVLAFTWGFFYWTQLLLTHTGWNYIGKTKAHASVCDHRGFKMNHPSYCSQKNGGNLWFVAQISSLVCWENNEPVAWHIRLLRSLLSHWHFPSVLPFLCVSLCDGVHIFKSWQTFGVSYQHIYCSWLPQQHLKKKKKALSLFWQRETILMFLTMICIYETYLQNSLKLALICRRSWSLILILSLCVSKLSELWKETSHSEFVCISALLFFFFFF